MRVVFYTNFTARDSVAVLERLTASQDSQLVYVYFYDTVGEARQSPLKILREFGWKKVCSKLFATVVSKLRQIVLKGPLRKLIKPRTSFELVVARRLPFAIVTDLNAQESQQHLRDLHPDLLLVCICKNILNKTTLEISRLAAVNIHPSLLPKYRGPMPIFWMLYHGESRAGVTFQRMTPRIDDGPVVAQFEMPLDLRRSEEAISRDLFALAAEKLEAVLDLIREGKAESVEPVGPGSYFSYPSREDQHELKRIQRQRMS